MMSSSTVLPQILSEKAKVGFASAPAWIAFSPVKNNAADAASAAKGCVPRSAGL